MYFDPIDDGTKKKQRKWSSKIPTTAKSFPKELAFF
jgi:hypothetical protein